MGLVRSTSPEKGNPYMATQPPPPITEWCCGVTSASGSSPRIQNMSASNDISTSSFLSATNKDWKALRGDLGFGQQSEEPEHECFKEHLQPPLSQDLQ